MMRLTELNMEIRKKIDAYCQRQKCNPGTLLSGGIRFMRIFGGSVAKGPQTTVGWPKPAMFGIFGRH